MFKEFFDCIKLNTQVKVMKEELKTIQEDVKLCKELMEHPLRKQNTINALLDDMKDTCEKGLK